MYEINICGLVHKTKPASTEKAISYLSHTFKPHLAAIKADNGAIANRIFSIGKFISILKLFKSKFSSFSIFTLADCNLKLLIKVKIY